MGSATESNAKPQIPMAENDKRTFKKLLKVFFKKDKKKEKVNEVNEVTEVVKEECIAAQAVENVLQKIEKLHIKDTEKLDDKEDEFENFSFKTVKDEGRNDRSDSHSSEDSGFAEKLDEATDGEDERKDDDVIEALEKLDALKIGSKEDDDKCQKEKKKQTVVVSRAPVRPKLGEYKAAPYYVQPKDPCRQVINKHTLTGGAVIVNSATNDFQEVTVAFSQVQQTSQHSQRESQDEWLNIIDEYIQDDSALGSYPEPKLGTENEPVEDCLLDFFQPPVQQNFYPDPVLPEESITMTPPHPEQTISNFYTETQNPITDLSKHDYDILKELALPSLTYEVPSYQSPSPPFVFPTPPHSENAASPMSDSQGSFRTSEYLYSPTRSVVLSSPERSSPICNSDYEKFQEISHFEEASPEEDKKERNSSTSSMTMKQYKDLQKEISHGFSKKDCCQLTRKSCKQQFQEHLQKLPVEERKRICLSVAKLNLEDAYTVLQNILISLSQSSDHEDLHHALFCLISERVLAQKPEWYIEDFGLNLLKSAALRCSARPLLTRHLVQCVRAAIRINPTAVQGKDSVFHEVDAQGDTLVSACARRGDSCADALAELVRTEPDELPLFRIHHLNCDGASALHVACSEHSTTSPRLLITHVLLDHGGADLWQGDAKAGDTPVHMAVNSKNCELRLIMVLFKHIDRKLWKKLAHAQNLCSTTPLDYARAATKSQIRDGYPAEVLEFLKKCR